MEARLNAYKLVPAAMKAMMGMEQAVQASGLEKSLLELVKIRASQLNGCAFCLEMHTRDAAKLGETPARMHMLAAWHEANCYTDRERAALDWTEALTLVAQTRAPDAVYEEALRHFSEEELVKLTLAIVTINGWNRFAVGFRSVPGTQPLVDEAFATHRRRLTALAYRFLGSIADAEDVVQAAWIRWQSADRGGVAEPGAFLARVVTRLCLDELKSARRQRETYIGPWLPEPVVESDPLAAREADEDLSVALMLALERLSPLERAAFLLHDVFGSNFDSVATVLDRSPAACRQLAARAREHVQSARPRFPVAPQDGARIALAFRTAIDSGDPVALGRMLAADAVLRTDGGGVVSAARNPVLGGERIARFFAGLSRKGRLGGTHEAAWINGMPGYVTRYPDGSVQTTALELDDGLITGVNIMRNPAKLLRVQ